MVGGSEIAYFENFLVEEVGHFFAGRRNAEATSIAVESRKLHFIVAQEVKTLEA